MHKTSYISKVLQYIENHLMSEIDPESVAKRHFISLSQLYRDFYTYTGHSIKEYIRKRRISNTCEKIKCSSISLSVIADESGCQTQQAFNKQFKSIVGMTPLEYRQSDTYFYFYPYSVDDISIAVKVGYEEIPECTTKRFYDSCLVGIEDKAIASLNEINGRIFGRNGKQIGHQFCYEVMTEVNFMESDWSEISGIYATCIVNYNEQDINGGWNYLFNIWLSNSMFEQSEEAYFEEFLFKNGKLHKLKLYLPVKKRKTAQHITIMQIPEIEFIVAREKGINAERKASEKVMKFLQERCPLLIKSAQRFYVCAYEDIYECGVECGGGLKLPCDTDLEIIHISSGKYALLQDDCLGDIRVGGDKLNAWLINNSINHDNKPVFAVYETQTGNYDKENISMKLYKHLKNDKNG
jgi:AraC-like DNA-binding protein/DNA gyrase inhibitor GyrI